MTRPRWSFDYSPPAWQARPTHSGRRWVIATETAADPSVLAERLQSHGVSTTVTAAIERAPVFWYRVHCRHSVSRTLLERVLSAGEAPLRYVASDVTSDLRLAPPLSLEGARPAAAAEWQARPPRPRATDSPGGSRWFLDHRTGVDVERGVCGGGAGARLAVIDDEIGEVDVLDLDAMPIVGDEAPSDGACHGASMVAWASGTRGDRDRRLPPFVGVAPDASVRLYVMPKPDRGLLWLPLCIVRAVLDGADVVVCASYIESSSSPMLDDALTIAQHLGRNGLGTAVVVPTGREVSSAPESHSASLTLRLQDPASDPRVLCIAPSGRDGGWFLWKDRRSRLRPFANRGPSVRCSAPGDDIAFPFSGDDRYGHAESSGASAIAAGVATLALSMNPLLRVSELYRLLTDTSEHTEQHLDLRPADPADLLPIGRDPDGHDAKCGYGRMSAQKACLAGSDPICAALVQIGEVDAARRYLELVSGNAGAYSQNFAWHCARAMITDPDLRHSVLSLVRHLRLLGGREEWQRRHGVGSLLRLVGLALRSSMLRTPHAAAAEAAKMLSHLQAIEPEVAVDAIEQRIVELSRLVFAKERYDAVVAPRSDSA